MKKKYFFIVLGVAALVLCTIALTSVGPQVVLLNECGEGLRDLQLEYDGGSSVVKALANKEAVSLKILPSEESSLRIRFLDAKGVVQSRALDCYFEPHYASTIQIRFSPNDEVSWRQKDGLFPGRPESWSENWKRSSVVVLTKEPGT